MPVPTTHYASPPYDNTTDRFVPAVWLFCAEPVPRWIFHISNKNNWSAFYICCRPYFGWYEGIMSCCRCCERKYVSKTLENVCIDWKNCSARCTISCVPWFCLVSDGLSLFLCWSVAFVQLINPIVKTMQKFSHWASLVVFFFVVVRGILSLLRCSHLKRNKRKFLPYMMSLWLQKQRKMLISLIIPTLTLGPGGICFCLCWWNVYGQTNVQRSTRL